MSHEILVFGDSIAHGLFQWEEALSWADLLKRRIGKDSASRVFNLSIPGDDTAGTLDRFEHEAAFRGRDVVIFAIGINDTKCLHTRNTQLIPLEAFAANARELIGKAKRFTEHVAWVGLTPISSKLTAYMKQNGYPYIYDATIIHMYDMALRELCAEIGVLYIDMAWVLEEADLFDGLHPNGDGQKKMFEHISAQLDPLVSSASGMMQF